MKKLFFLLLLSSFVICFSSCKEDELLNSSTVTDIDGNVYHSVKIGTQTWMVENLKVRHYNDGTVIPSETDNSLWNSLSTGAYCYYNNDVVNESKYGVLYNWYAVNTGKLAPKGWHVPSQAEWIVLYNYLLENDYHIFKNNKTGFSPLAGGCRYYSTSLFIDFGHKGYWWGTTEYDTESATYAYFYYYGIGLDYAAEGKRNGFSVRCIKD